MLWYMNNFNSCFRKLTLPVAVLRMGKWGILLSSVPARDGVGQAALGIHPRFSVYVYYGKKKEHILENTALDKGQPSVHILAFPAFPAVIRTRWKTSKQVSSPCLWVPQGELQA